MFVACLDEFVISVMCVCFQTGPTTPSQGEESTTTAEETTEEVTTGAPGTTAPPATTSGTHDEIKGGAET